MRLSPCVQIPRSVPFQLPQVPRVPLLEKEHAELSEALASAEQARVDAESSAAELEAALQRELEKLNGETRALMKEKNCLRWTLKQGSAIWGDEPVNHRGDDENMDVFSQVMPSILD